MSLFDFLVGAVVGGILVALVTTETGRTISKTTGKLVSEKYAQLVE